MDAAFDFEHGDPLVKHLWWEFFELHDVLATPNTFRESGEDGGLDIVIADEALFFGIFVLFDKFFREEKLQNVIWLGVGGGPLLN